MALACFDVLHCDSTTLTSVPTAPRRDTRVARYVDDMVL